ncbi:WSC domain-containing protein [Podospora appendiculata]|uniref:WSC domain-containing protein n=1 Tax=Podospora appendiculata TaxID=314037 RepID=A0AAE1CIN0_9PEZI|nr:WSC domain-containing protein [Podospora appendiculata]
MGWLIQAFVAVPGLLSLVGNTGVDVQGYFGTVARENAECPSTADDFRYLGCYKGFNNAVTASFGPSPQRYNPPGDPSWSFPGWDPGSDTDNTMTPLTCARACRGLGYKYAAVRDNNCNCGLQLEPDTLSITGGVCNIPCYGDISQTCGGDDAQVYVDPTFADLALVPYQATGNAALAASYQYLGCFYAPYNFRTDDAHSDIFTNSMETCLSLCAGLGYPYAVGTPQTGQVHCNCGTNFGVGAYRVHPAGIEGCGYDCAETVGVTCDPTSTVAGAPKCCGRHDYYPVYINPELEGCYTPIIPGYKNSTDQPFYECGDVPLSLTGSAKTLAEKTYTDAQPGIGTKINIAHPDTVVDAGGGGVLLLRLLRPSNEWRP